MMQDLRMKDIEESKFDHTNPSKFKIETVGDTRFLHFFFCFARVQTILYTRIGVDEFDKLYARQVSLFKDYLTLSADGASNKVPEAKRLLTICLCIIFIIHATITDESSKSKSLAQVFQAPLPTYALKQLSDFILQITDRILQVPSSWVMVLTPLLVWLSLHREDGLAQTLFDQSPVLRQELTRVHSLLAQFCLDNQTLELQKNLKKHEREDRLADKQLVVLELLGSSLIFEENFLLGFLPLRSYFQMRKQPDLNGKKCPQDKEELVRGLVIKESLELLGCVQEESK